MTGRAFGIIFFALIACATSFGQSSFQGLTPGRSTKADVERALGQPIRSASRTLVEYRSPAESGRLFVQYGDESAAAAVVERIELTCFTGRSNSRSEYDLCVSALNLERLQGVLPDAESRTPKQQGFTIVRYFGAPQFTAWTHIAKGVEAEVRLAFYSEGLYQSAAPKGGCTGTIFGTWQTERGRVTIVRVGDEGVRGTYAKNNGSFSLKQVRGGYAGEWRDDTGSGTMALMLDGGSFRASLSRGPATASKSQPAARSEVGAKLGSLIEKAGSGAAVGEIITAPSEPSFSRVTGLPPGEPLTGKCVP